MYILHAGLFRFSYTFHLRTKKCYNEIKRLAKIILGWTVRPLLHWYQTLQINWVNILSVDAVFLVSPGHQQTMILSVRLI